MDHSQIFFVVVAIWGITQVTGQEATPSGVRFVGVGYNLVDGNPEGGDANNGGVDPGLLSTRQILALTYNENRMTNGFLVPDEVTFSPRQSCVNESSRSTFFGTQSYQDSLTLSVDASMKFFRRFAFSNSFGYKRVQSAVEKEHKVIYEETEVCNLGRARYRKGLASQFSLTDEFASDVCELSTVYNESQYMDFLENWGTHIVVEIDVGHKVIHRSEARLSEFYKHAVRNVKNSVSVGGAYAGFAASLNVDINYFNAEMSSGSSFGSSSYTFRIGNDDLQEPVHIKVIPIVDIFKPKHWTSLEDFVQKGVCNYNFSVSKIKVNIYTALTGYTSWKQLNPSSDMDLSIPITWPKGTYGLPKLVCGCPGDTWKTGFRKHKDYLTMSTGSNPLHFDVSVSGPYDDYWHTIQNFCIKTVDEEVMDDWEFQEGHYCIYRKGGACPTGFDEGSVEWGDEANFRASEGVGGSVPDGIYEFKTVIYFCCRNDGFYENPILLPTDEPFMLLAKSFECQQVYGMDVTKESFRFYSWHGSTISGSIPMKGEDELTFYYCYYKSNT